MSSIRSIRRKPTHPGAILREDILPALAITQTQLAVYLQVSRRTISEIIHERRPLSPDMAIRLAHFLGTTPESWLNMQQSVDIWQLENGNHMHYEAIHKYSDQEAA